ncbi:hypothetical protein F5B22DRAFT_602999 [Xylaria bambusicola]|uniref:uncharacterized protein n=1 Tax=Xylaria bambusicola TaxID=326684 RepID=UPI0020079B5E|nr:uncharacterized protein F5B22DRAFT_602999 [Xylaria bambusicola]KAI0517447.1 hypothetical protein F5B22DRAFT_602999 [Xylaria bambusicola]
MPGRSVPGSNPPTLRGSLCLSAFSLFFLFAYGVAHGMFNWLNSRRPALKSQPTTQLRQPMHRHLALSVSARPGFSP